MSNFNEVLKSAVLEYITTNNGKVDYVDINHHFKLHAALIATGHLEDEGKINRVWNGRCYLFEISK